MDQIEPELETSKSFLKIITILQQIYNLYYMETYMCSSLMMIQLHTLHH